MFCKVYALYERGEKLDRECARAGGREGWLEFRRSPVGAPEEHARLLVDRDGPEVDRLNTAHVRFIKGGGIMITGTEVGSEGSNTKYWPQSWWCVPSTPALPVPDQQLALLAAPAP